MYSEDQLIEMIRKRFANYSATIGIGDDAAVIDLPRRSSTVVCSDLLAENVHFKLDTHPADSIGFKAIAANVSDIGAMGGLPNYCLISLAVPHDLELSWLESFLDGVESACRKFKVELIGGDSSTAERVFVDASIIGRVSQGRAVTRSGARPGNSIYVTGALGGSSLGLELLKNGNQSHPAVSRHLYPEPRYSIGAKLTELASAMTDISDGLSVDLANILKASEVSAKIESDLIPIYQDADLSRALHGGEEYELVITAEDLPSILDGVSITKIGEIIPCNGEPTILLVDGRTTQLLKPDGWKHF